MENEERKELENYLSEIRKELNLRLTRFKDVEQKFVNIEQQLKDLEQTRLWQRGDSGTIAEADKYRRKLVRERATLESERDECSKEVKLARERESMVLEQLKAIGSSEL